jgi:hypothetical protein
MWIKTSPNLWMILVDRFVRSPLMDFWYHSQFYLLLWLCFDIIHISWDAKFGMTISMKYAKLMPNKVPEHSFVETVFNVICHYVIVDQRRRYYSHERRLVAFSSPVPGYWYNTTFCGVYMSASQLIIVSTACSMKVVSMTEGGNNRSGVVKGENFPIWKKYRLYVLKDRKWLLRFLV